jgi:hypothetical protein
MGKDRREGEETLCVIGIGSNAKGAKALEKVVNQAHMLGNAIG